MAVPPVISTSNVRVGAAVRSAPTTVIVTVRLFASSVVYVAEENSTVTSWGNLASVKYELSARVTPPISPVADSDPAFTAPAEKSPSASVSNTHSSSKPSNLRFTVPTDPVFSVRHSRASRSEYIAVSKSVVSPPLVVPPSLPIIRYC